MSEPSIVVPATLSRSFAALYTAWAIALAATLGALFIGEVLGQAPCHLCWYQRIAMFPLALFLGLAALSSDLGIRRYALPLALIGGLVSAYHSGLFLGIIPEPIVPCSPTGPSCTDANMTILGLPLPFPSPPLLALPMCSARSRKPPPQRQTHPHQARGWTLPC